MKLFKVFILVVVFLLGIFASTASSPSVLAGSLQTDQDKQCFTSKFPILMYHHVREYDDLDEEARVISVSLKEFEEQMEFLATHGYFVITPKDITRRTVPCNSVMITFDDGYKDVAKAAEIMKKYGFPGVLGLIVDRMDEMGYLSGKSIRALQKSGWEIANHTWSHFNLSNIKASHLTHEITDSKNSLDEWFNTDINTFVYPGGFYGPMTKEEVKNSGHTYALTTHYGYADLRGSLMDLSRIDMVPGITFNKFAQVLEDGRFMQ